MQEPLYHVLLRSRENRKKKNEDFMFFLFLIVFLFFIVVMLWKINERTKFGFRNV